MAGEVVVLAPAIVATRLGESMRERHVQQSFRRRVLAGDLQAQAKCVLYCAGYSRLDDGAQLLQRSAARVLTEWDANPPGEALPVLMAAHAYEARLLQKEQPQLAAQHWRRLAVLSTDPRVVPALRSGTYDANGYDVDYYTRLAVEAQSELIEQSRLAGGGVADHPATGDACVPVAPWPPAWMTTGNDAKASLQLACSFARPGVSQ